MSGDSTDLYTESEEPESELDPRIQIELEGLNNATDDINKLEMELDESNTTFRMLMNESTRRLKILNRKLGSCIERARPYYEALEVAKQSQQECQKAAVKFQRANEIHQAAKETVALAEARFLSKQHEWKFDSAWQEMLNNAIQKVTDAENQKSESGREHQKKATLFNAAETKVQLLEQRLKRNIVKSRPYFEEKALCESQLNTQKARVLQLREAVKAAKAQYAASLRRLEDISEEIHMRRRRESTCGSPTGPREPGVGAELSSLPLTETVKPSDPPPDYSSGGGGFPPAYSEDTQSLDVDFDLDKCDVRSLGGSSVTNSSRMSYDSGDESSSSGMNQEDLEKLRMRVRELATTPVEGWESELDATVNKLDNMLHLQECDAELKKQSEALKQQHTSPTEAKHQKTSPTDSKHTYDPLKHQKLSPSDTPKKGYDPWRKPTELKQQTPSPTDALKQQTLSSAELTKGHVRHELKHTSPTEMVKQRPSSPFKSVTQSSSHNGVSTNPFASAYNGESHASRSLASNGSVSPRAISHVTDSGVSHRIPSATYSGSSHPSAAGSCVSAAASSGNAALSSPMKHSGVLLSPSRHLSSPYSMKHNGVESHGSNRLVSPSVNSSSSLSSDRNGLRSSVNNHGGNVTSSESSTKLHNTLDHPLRSPVDSPVHTVYGLK